MHASDGNAMMHASDGNTMMHASDGNTIYSTYLHTDPNGQPESKSANNVAAAIITPTDTYAYLGTPPQSHQSASDAGPQQGPRAPSISRVDHGGPPPLLPAEETADMRVALAAAAEAQLQEEEVHAPSRDAPVYNPPTLDGGPPPLLRAARRLGQRWGRKRRVSCPAARHF